MHWGDDMGMKQRYKAMKPRYTSSRQKLQGAGSILLFLEPLEGVQPVNTLILDSPAKTVREQIPVLLSHPLHVVR